MLFGIISTFLFLQVVTGNHLGAEFWKRLLSEPGTAVPFAYEEMEAQEVYYCVRSPITNALSVAHLYAFLAHVGGLPLGRPQPRS